MKKYIALLLSVIIIVACFIGCSSNDKNKDKETTSSSVSASANKDAEAEKATAKAKIKESEAINFIKSAYTKEELGLEDVEQEYSFMVAQTPEKIDGKEYIKVAANVMAQNDETAANGQPTYSLTAVGEYYISFDGKTVMSRDLKTGKYKKLENKYDAYKADSKQTETTKKTDSAKTEKATKK